MKRLKNEKSNGGLEFEVNNWELSQLVLDKLVPVVGVHPFPLSELLLMSAAVAHFKPQIIFEWGTHIGKSARIFYEISRALDLKTTINSIDLFDDQEHAEHPKEQRGVMVRGLKNVKLHQGDGVSVLLEVLARQKPAVKKGEGVLVFVDGDHSYESVKRELSAIIKSAPQAAILLHDTFYQDPKSNYNVGPYKAINDCLKTSKTKYERIETKTGLPGMTLLSPVR